VNGETHINTVTTTVRLGALLHATGRREEGRRLLDSAAANVGEGTPNIAPQITGLVRRLNGASLIAEGALEDAAHALADDVETTRRAYPASVRLADALRVHGQLFTALGRYAEAESALDEALAVRKSALGAAAPANAFNAFVLESARLHLARGEPAAALEMLDRIADVPASGEAPLWRDATSARILRAQTLLQLGRAADAESAARAALDEVVRSPLRERLPRLEADAALRLGEAQRRGGRAAAALPDLERAAALREASDDPRRSPWLAEARIALADCLADLGQRAAARAALASAAAIEASHAQLGKHLRAPLRRVEARLGTRAALLSGPK